MIVLRKFRKMIITAIWLVCGALARAGLGGLDPRPPRRHPGSGTRSGALGTQVTEGSGGRGAGADHPDLRGRWCARSQSRSRTYRRV